jgi:hypothetical protein
MLSVPTWSVPVKGADSENNFILFDPATSHNTVGFFGGVNLVSETQTNVMQHHGIIF